MSKFDKAFAEVKLYIPMDSEVWQDFRETAVYQSLIQSGLAIVHNTKPKGVKKNDRN